MHLKTPKFWFNNNHEISPLLYTLKPLSKLWELAIRFRLKNGLWEKMPIHVICVGNLTIGGSGKTPVTMSLQKLLEDMGIKACIVSRGYKGKIQRPHYVTKNDTFDKVGDEPLMLSKKGAIIVSKNKKEGIIKAYNDGYDIVILDDGFQNSRIKKDISFEVVDSKILFGNELIFPLGPLREPINSGFDIKNYYGGMHKQAENEFYLHLLGQDVIVPGVRLSFICDAHTDDDVSKIIDSMKYSFNAVREDGLF